MPIPVNAKENNWLKKLAWAAPLFFLIKGLLWLTVPAALALWGLE